jgi:hypothetical protein
MSVVFIVIWSGVHEEAISSVWSTREAAEAEAQRLQAEDMCSDYSVNEWEVKP